MRPLMPVSFSACLLLGLLPGCSYDRPPVDLDPLLRMDHATSQPPQLLPSRVASPNPNVPTAATTPRSSTSAEELRPPIANGGVVQFTSLAAPDSPSTVQLLSLPEAIQLGLRYNPRLLTALSAIERARGQEQAAFAPFLPQIDLLNRYVATSK